MTETDQNLSVEFLSTVIEHVAHPIFVKDRQFRFVLVNRALCEMVGYDREEMLGKTDYDFFQPEEADFFREKDVEMFATEAKVTIDEEPITDSRGDVHVLATTKVPARNADGEVTHLVGIIHDITQIKRAEEALRNARDELERRVVERTAELRAAQQQLLRKERLSVLGQLAGGLAHQLRNPLGAIQNAVSLLRKAALPPSTFQTVDIVEEEVQRADRTIRSLLDYARIRPASRRRILLQEVVKETIEQARLPANVTVEIADADGTAAYLDPLQIQTALGNVVCNAMEAMTDGGRLEVSSTQHGELVHITVCDSGPGIADDLMQQLFDPLVTTKPQGSGLGLSTARSLVENHGGTIRCDNRSEGGARFVIELPAGPPPSEAQRAFG